MVEFTNAFLVRRNYSYGISLQLSECKNVVVSLCDEVLPRSQLSQGQIEDS